MPDARCQGVRGCLHDPIPRAPRHASQARTRPLSVGVTRAHTRPLCGPAFGPPGLAASRRRPAHACRVPRVCPQPAPSFAPGACRCCTAGAPSAPPSSSRPPPRGATSGKWTSCAAGSQRGPSSSRCVRLRVTGLLIVLACMRQMHTPNASCRGRDAAVCHTTLPALPRVRYPVCWRGATLCATPCAPTP